MPEEQRAQPGVHPGATSLADVMEYGPFRQLYPDWDLPLDHLVEQDAILLKVRPATRPSSIQLAITLVTRRVECRDSRMP